MFARVPVLTCAYVYDVISLLPVRMHIHEPGLLMFEESFRLQCTL